MFRKDTAIVTGAGASWHYGYPTGEQLVADVIASTKLFQRYCQTRLEMGVHMDHMPRFVAAKLKHNPHAHRPAWEMTIAECAELINRLNYVAPVVIDYFLGWNEPLHEIGRMMIAGALLRREAHGAGKNNYNRWLLHVESGAGGLHEETFPYYRHNDNWLRYVIHQLLLDCRKSEDLLENKLKFITFNYDRSLERNLRKALQSINFLKQEHIDQFFEERILHMYGALAEVPQYRVGDFNALRGGFSGSGTLDQIHKLDLLLNDWSAAGEPLGVIDPHTKPGPNSSVAKTILENSGRMYFLGFGFDKNNLARLHFPSGSSQYNQREIFFTNMGNSLSINKRVSQALSIQIMSQPDNWAGQNTHFICEKSVRDVYGAIELDFGALSE